jgi:hypothetical protein
METHKTSLSLNKFIVKSLKLTPSYSKKNSEIKQSKLSDIAIYTDGSKDKNRVVAAAAVM